MLYDRNRLNAVFLLLAFLLTTHFAGAQSCNYQCLEPGPVYLPDNGRFDLEIADFLALPDSCSLADSLVIQPPFVDCSDAGDTVAYRILNRFTNAVICQGALPVLDTTPPKVRCLEQVVLTLPASGFPAILYPPMVIESIDDNCSRVTDFSMRSQMIFSCGQTNQPLPYVLTVQATGDTVCMGTVVVVDTTAPVMQCRDTFTLVLGPAGTALAPEIGEVLTSFKDNCLRADDLVWYGPDTFSCEQLGRDVEYGLGLGGGTAPLCRGVIQLIDTAAQRPSCREVVTVVLPAMGSVQAIDPALVIAGDLSACVTLENLEVWPGEVDCALAGDSVRYALRDTLVDTTWCEGILLVVDTTSRQVKCLDTLMVELDAEGQLSGLLPQDVILEYQDNCQSIFSLQLLTEPVSCESRVTEYFIREKPAGDTICRGMIVVDDVVRPQARCRSQVIVELPANGFPAVLYPPMVLEDFSAGSCVGINDLTVTPATFTCEDANRIRLYELKVQATGEVLCSGSVYVADPTPPFVTCRDSVSIFLPADGGAARLRMADVLLSFQDLCSDASGLVLGPRDSFTCSDVGLSFIYQLRMPMISQTLCQGVVTIVDTSSTTLLCKPNVTVYLPDSSGFLPLTPEMVLQEGSFNCSALGGLRVTPGALDCSEAGRPKFYRLQSEETGQTLCFGRLVLEDTTSALITCRDTLQVYLPEQGGSLRLYPDDVITRFKDNCTSYLDLELLPGQVNCSMAGVLRPYFVATRSGRDTLCSGMLEVLDTVEAKLEVLDTVRLRLAGNGFPAILFPPTVIRRIKGGCLSMSDLTVYPTLFFCPDVSDYQVRLRSTGEVLARGVVIVEGTSPFCGSVSPAVNQPTTLPVALDLELFPNPANEVLNVRIPYGVENARLAVFDIFGRQVLEQQVSDGAIRFEVQLASLPAGTYALTIFTGGQPLWTRRFVR